MRMSFLFPLLVPIILLSNQSALAKWGTFTMTDENGEQVKVKHGLFGKKTIVKDRFGNGVATKQGIFGINKDTQVSAVGNNVQVHKGLLGSQTEVEDMLGDKITSNKNLLYSNTNVDLSGVNRLLNKYFGPKMGNPSTIAPVPAYQYQPGLGSASNPNSLPVANPIEPFQPSTNSKN